VRQVALQRDLFFSAANYVHKNFTFSCYFTFTKENNAAKKDFNEQVPKQK
jgi:hypothetical protein